MSFSWNLNNESGFLFMLKKSVNLIKLDTPCFFLENYSQKWCASGAELQFAYTRLLSVFSVLGDRDLVRFILGQIWRGMVETLSKNF